MADLRIGTAGGKPFSLPLELVTQTIAILAKRRAGKSYTMRRLTEQLVKARQQVVLVDPKGDQWGIRSSADGSGPGLPVLILGGERGDAPLEPSSGEIVAKLVVEERVSAVLDLSLFRKHEVATFMTGFLENLYRLKARERYRTPMMLVVDEADAVAPQKPQKGEERMLGAAEDIVRRGGQRGIGCTLVTQRSAVLNKNVLTQAQMMVALRTIAPQDLDAMKAWIEVHGTDEQRSTLMESLPSLPTGDAWFWSPGWPTTEGIFARVQVAAIETFDSGATPKPGETCREPRTVADVDLEALKRTMAATIEKAKAENPKELQRRIRELEAELRKRTGSAAADSAAIELAVAAERERCITIFKRETAEFLSSLRQHLRDLHRRIRDLSDAGVELGTLVDSLVPPEVEGAPARYIPTPLPAARRARSDKPGAPPPTAASTRPAAPPDGGEPRLSASEKALLDAIAWYQTIGVDAPTRTQVAGFTGISTTKSTFRNLLSRLRTLGYIEDVAGDRLILTDAGSARAVPPERPPTLADIHTRFSAELSSSQVELLQLLIAAHPDSLSRTALAEALGMDPGVSTLRNNLSRLRTLGLLEDRSREEVAAAALLFPEGLT